jgi:hypothetical protein
VKCSVRGFRKILFSLTTLATLLLPLSCTKPYGSDGNYLIPWPNGADGYERQSVHLSTFDEPEHLSGSIATMYVSPGLDGTSLSQRGRPVGRFIHTQNGDYAPSDPTSIEATTVYAHLERLHEMDVAVGSAAFLNWPAKVAVEVHISGGDPTAKENNAQYDGGLDALLIVPYLDEVNLPITENAGVIGHEHFHSIFYALVLKPLVQEKSLPPSNLSEKISEPSVRLRCTVDSLEQKDVHALKSTEYNDIYLRALNEGLADFWGWVYSGDTTFVGRSLPRDLASRSLKAHSDHLDSAEISKSNVESMPSGCQLPWAYVIGTQYARFLHDLSVQSFGANPSYENRLKMARAVLQSLGDFQKQASQNFKAQTLLSPDLFVSLIYQHLPLVTAQSCDLYSRFVTWNGRSQMPDICKPASPVPADSAR